MKSFRRIRQAIFLLAISLCLSACVQTTANYSLNLKADKELALPGEKVNFTTEIIGDPVKKEISYEITAGNNYATITSDGVLSISEDAPALNKISVISKTSDRESNVVVITVGTKLLSIEASSNKSEIIVGQSATLRARLNPTSADTEPVSWVIVEGASNCSISGDSLIVNEDAEIDSVIKVKAVSGDIESNLLEFTIKSGKSEKLFLSLSDSSIVIDKYASNNVILQTTVYNADYQKLDDQIIDYEIVEGSEYLAISQENNTCFFEALGHGTATVKATVRGTSYFTTATVDVIVPPTALKLHEVFSSRPGYNYNYSLANTLKFPVEIIENNVCTDYNVVFSDSSMAEYDKETSEITFKKTGIVTVIVTSNSGSKLETSVSYTFNINDGINVFNYEQLKSTLESSTYNGQIINIAVFDKPVSDNYNYEYGYDLVPEFALKAQAEHTFDDIVTNKLGSIQANDKNVHINGNNHKIDLSQVRVIEKSEFGNTGGAINYMPYPALYVASTTAGKAIEVKIYDFEITGNSSPNYDGTIYNKHAVGTYSRGLHIGEELINSVVYIDINNITLSNFDCGMRIYHVIGNGVVKNVYVYNCFGNGIESYANIITFENMKYGYCGGPGIELSPNSDEKAGTTFDQKQHVTFAGSITTTNVTDGSSNYMEEFSAGGYTVMQILNTVLSNYSEETLSNVLQDGKFVFVSFIFNDLNTLTENNSLYEYKNIDGAGIINIKDLEKSGNKIDTTHKYIEVDVEIEELNLSVGKVLVYNFNYVE